MDDQSQSTATKINAMKARQSFGKLLEEVFYREEQFVIERAGRPMAALVPLSQLEALQKDSGPVTSEHNPLKDNRRRPKKRRA